MIRISIDLIPYGFEDLKRNISEIEIINTGDHPKSPYYGNYDISIKLKEEKKLVNFKIKDFFRPDRLFSLLNIILEKYNAYEKRKD